MKTIKRLFSLTLIVTMGLGLVGCASPANDREENNPKTYLTTLEKAVDKLNQRTSFQYAFKAEGTQFVAESGNVSIQDIDEAGYNFTSEVFNENQGNDYYVFRYYDADYVLPGISHSSVSDSLYEGLSLLKNNESYIPDASSYSSSNIEGLNNNLIQPFLDLYTEYSDYFKIEQRDDNDNKIIKITCIDTDGFRKAKLENIDIEELNESFGYDRSKEGYKTYTVEFTFDQNLNIISLESNVISTFNNLQSEYHQTYTFSDLNKPTFTLEEIKAMLAEAKNL